MFYSCKFLQRIAETLDVEIKRWAAGKEGNLRALLSTMQYVCLIEILPFSDAPHFEYFTFFFCVEVHGGLGIMGHFLLSFMEQWFLWLVMRWLVG